MKGWRKSNGQVWNNGDKKSQKGWGKVGGKVMVR